ncbi:MAG: NAD-dependent epimerase/dehydratase family protein [Solirubrobacterales bacterium]|nr:NAD-dependent epimerase/dehydratase family protein [Solirubrobacterales bacterium]
MTNTRTPTPNVPADAPSTAAEPGTVALSILVTGVTGFVGGALAERLRHRGMHVRGLARKAPATDLGYPVAIGDLESGAGLEPAMRGVDVAVYLVHSMEGSGDFSEQERRSAEYFTAAAQRAGVRRVVYLGGLVPEEDSAGGSEHLESRNDVEDILLEGFPEAVAFRASMVIGHGSRSFDFLASLVERLPVLALPSWRSNRTRPIHVDDVMDYLTAAITSDDIHEALRLDIGGADEIGYGDLVGRIGELAGKDRPTVGLPFDATPLASRLAAKVAGEDKGLIEPLMESLQYDLLPDDDDARARFGVQPKTLDDAIRDALADRNAGTD